MLSCFITTNCVDAKGAEDARNAQQALLFVVEDWGIMPLFLLQR